MLCHSASLSQISWKIVLAAFHFYVGHHVRRCNLREQNGKRSMVITDVPTVEEAVSVLHAIAQ